VSEISRHYSAEQLAPTFWVLFPGSVRLDPADAMDRTKTPRYRLLGTANLFERGWKLTLVEER
jgi:hypothetical protein